MTPTPTAHADGGLLPATAWMAGTDELGQESMVHILHEYPDVNVIMSINDAGAFGAVKALRAAGKGPKEVLIFSVDADPNAVKMIKAGEYFRGSIATDPVTTGRLAVDALVKLLAGHAVPMHIPLRPRMITRENAAAQMAATAALTNDVADADAQ